MDAQQVLFRIIVKLQIALIGIMYRFAEPTRKMDIGCGNQYSAVFFFDCHDPLERMLGAFTLLDVLCQVQYFLAMSEKKFTLQGQKTGRILVVYAMTGGTDLLVGSRLSLLPVPAPFMKYRAALGTHTRLRDLRSCLIGIMHPLLEHLVAAGDLAKTGGSGMRAHDQAPVGEIACRLR